MTWHIIDGEDGCAFAAAHGLAAIIVDALRASATAAMLLEHGAEQITVAREVDEALALKAADPGALLFGERNGLPPAGFDSGNSPRETAIARGRRVIFTTTNGARRLVAAQGAPLVIFATTTNASAAAQYVLANAPGAVLIPAGLERAPKEAATEDRVAAAFIAHVAGVEVGEGAEIYREFLPCLSDEGLLSVFNTAPHAAAMRALGLDDDIVFCARTNLTAAVPRVHHWDGSFAIMRDAHAARPAR